MTPSTAMREVATMSSGPAGASWRPPAGGGPDPGERLVAVLHDRHGAALLGYATRLCGDRHAAEDLVQETLVRAWRHRAELTQDDDAVRGWLFTVVRNLAYDRGRARLRRPEQLAGDAVAATPDAAPDPAQGVVDRLTLRDALDRLSPDHREVLASVQVLGLSVAETAQRLGIPEGTVKSRCYYALKALRAAYRDLEGGR